MLTPKEEESVIVLLKSIEENKVTALESVTVSTVEDGEEDPHNTLANPY